MNVAELDIEDLEPLTDDELTALALAADPDAEVDDDAEPFWTMTAGEPNSLLPEWYMPTSSGGGPRLQGWRRRAVLLVVIISFLAIAASGLCSTYGQIVVA